jgi:hypothetical protein
MTGLYLQQWQCFARQSEDPANMIDAWVIVLILVSSFNGGPEVKQLSGVSEIVIDGWIAVI